MTALRRLWAGKVPATRPDRLTDLEWAAIRGHVVEGRTLAGIGRARGVTRETVRQAAHRAALKLAGKR
jgi:DNA-directed RNA polymerase specialized sigma24 family protein